MPIKKVTVSKDEDGFWTHPDLPVWGEKATQKELDAWAKENGIVLTVQDFEGYAPQELQDRYFEQKDSQALAEWNPSLPNSFLLSIHDTDDDPAAWLATPTM